VLVTTGKEYIELCTKTRGFGASATPQPSRSFPMLYLRYFQPSSTFIGTTSKKQSSEPLIGALHLARIFVGLQKIYGDFESMNCRRSSGRHHLVGPGFV
jgi:hypothetical protein